MVKYRIFAVGVLLIGGLIGYFDYSSQKEGSRFPFSLGLDLAGGTHLVYTADLSEILERDIEDSLDSLRNVIERRVNIFGVSEPVVQVEKHEEERKIAGRLIVELPGVTDISEAVNLIGTTPVLDFRTENPNVNFKELTFNPTTGNPVSGGKELSFSEIYLPSGLSGKHLSRAQVQFDQVTGEPYVALTFNGEGAELFKKITKENVGKTVAIFLDGLPIQTPVVQQEISGGQAQITGRYTLSEAKTFVERLNAGALPVPIKLLSTQNVGATLGAEAIGRGVRASFVGLAFVAIFFVLWYRLPGLLAVLSLSIYFVTVLALFKLFSVTLTAAGIAGFIISLGIAVDANVLIFERMKEERKRGRDFTEAQKEGFSRAWLSIRDSNFSSLISAMILFWFGTSLIKGFALTFAIGILVSMFTAIVVTRVFLYALNMKGEGKVSKFLLGSGI
jgi:protein-export membrane protein SecD